MPFKNRIRLPLQLHSPQYPEERQVFRKANGQAKTMSVVVRKTLELETDFMPDNWHQRLKIALAHDEIRIEGEKYLGSISQDGDYNIEWPEGVLHYPTAKAGVKVQVTPFDATNANCQTCEQASQLDLENDEATGIYGALQEDQDYSVSVADNDSICCYPAVFSLVSFNSDYLDSASIDPSTGVLSIHTGTDLVSANGVIIATYRVTCPDGSFDEANVTANIEGSIEGCLAPTNFIVGLLDEEQIQAAWTEPAPGSTYYWEIYLGSTPTGIPLQTDTTMDTNVNVSGLTPGTQYYFQVRTVCYGSNSNFVGGTVNTESISPDETCGEYNVNYNSLGGPPFASVTYMDCDGEEQTVNVFNFSDRVICALQTAAGLPVYIATGHADMTVNYLTLC